jgi:hypothetical protein
MIELGRACVHADHRKVCYWRDMTLVPHLLNLFFKRGIRSSCFFSPPRIPAGNRKEIARELHEEILSMRS